MDSIDYDDDDKTFSVAAAVYPELRVALVPKLHVHQDKRSPDKSPSTGALGSARVELSQAAISLCLNYDNLCLMVLS
jgi:hypothetical protein